MAIDLLPATRDDLSRILAYMQDYYAHDSVEFVESRAAAAADKLIGDAGLGGIWLIRREGTEVGYIALGFGYSLEFGGRDAFIDEFFISEPHRRKGVGQKTLELIESMCRQRGIKALHLEVERRNHTAQGLYRRCGFDLRERFALMSKSL